MPRRAPQTLADYMVVGISPALVMFMVGSLVWFLTIVFYQGDYGWRLLMVHAFFVMGAVSVTRLAMEEGAAYASIFGVVLAAVVAFAYISFVKVQGPLAALSPIINLGLEAVIWFSAHKLTWDCTLNDDTQDSTQEGLLQSMGFDRVEGEIPPGQMTDVQAPRTSAAAAETDSREPNAEATTSGEVQVFHWLRSLFVHDKRPHTPGVWIVYFSLAALPLFGIGQWFIPSDQLELRRQAFWLLVVYVASGLGLLLNTSFLGLRRYLRQRNLQMPSEMAAMWLGTGVVLILAVLAVVYLLPRPSAEYSVSQIDMFKSKPLDPSRWGWGKDGSQETTDTKGAGGEGGRKAEQAQSSKPGESKQQTSGQGKGAEKGDGEGEKSGGSSKGKSQGEKSSGGKGSGKDKSSDGAKTQESGSDGKKGDSKSGEKSDSESGSKQKAFDKDDRQSSDKANDRKNEQTTGQKSSQQESQASEDSSQEKSSDDSKSESQGETEKNDSPPADSSSRPPSSSYRSQPSWLSRLSPTLGQILKWLFYGLVLVTLVVLAWIYRHEIVAAWKKLLAELRALWARWFGGGPSVPGEEVVPSASPPRPFATYADPFASGLAGRASLAELVRYTFEALEAWGREHQSPRVTGQTAHEYAQQVGQIHQPLAGDVRFLAELYGQLAYAQGSLRQANVEPLKSLWQRMRGA